jgi:hypothetical protein
LKLRQDGLMHLGNVRLDRLPPYHTSLVTRRLAHLGMSGTRHLAKLDLIILQYCSYTSGEYWCRGESTHALRSCAIHLLQVVALEGMIQAGISGDIVDGQKGPFVVKVDPLPSEEKSQVREFVFEGVHLHSIFRCRRFSRHLRALIRLKGKRNTTLLTLTTDKAAEHFINYCLTESSQSGVKKRLSKALVLRLLSDQYKNLYKGQCRTLSSGERQKALTKTLSDVMASENMHFFFRVSAFSGRRRADGKFNRDYFCFFDTAASRNSVARAPYNSRVPIDHVVRGIYTI